MIAEAYEKHHLLLEPHGSVAWAGLNKRKSFALI